MPLAAICNTGNIFTAGIGSAALLGITTAGHNVDKTLKRGKVEHAGKHGFMRWLTTSSFNRSPALRKHMSQNIKL